MIQVPFTTRRGWRLTFDEGKLDGDHSVHMFADPQFIGRHYIIESYEPWHDSAEPGSLRAILQRPADRLAAVLAGQVARSAGHQRDTDREPDS